ncbi:hypothetical protein [Nitrospira lenta]|uniref:Uncharacterized protein n=1 Tax=Nitrospira lenta TaxID=1436998 RepID=A0A330L2P7_9BACT|nr:hypothetical protein [Nitrospira lenta]SPP64041.1 exported hypothetical protein [Nitrospira lenta]
MSATFLSAYVLAAALMNVEAESLPMYIPPPWWLPEPSYAFTGASSIPRELGEKLVMERTGEDAHRALSIVVLVTAEYAKVRAALLQTVTTQWGILQQHDNVTGPIPHKSPRLVGGAQEWPPLGESLVMITEDGKTPQLIEVEVLTNPYNIVESIHGSSQTLMRVSDGKGIWGHDLTLIQLMRVDRALEWAWAQFGSHPVFPLPYKKERGSLGGVTSTEIRLLESLKTSIPGVELRYFVPDLDINVNSSKRGALRSGISTAVEHFHEKSKDRK